jgi:hypothetical protein
MGLSLERRLHVSSRAIRSPVRRCRRRRWCPTCRLDSGVLEAEPLCCPLGLVAAWQVVVLVPQYNYTAVYRVDIVWQLFVCRKPHPSSKAGPSNAFCLGLHLPIANQVNAPTARCRPRGPCLPCRNRVFGRSNVIWWIVTVLYVQSAKVGVRVVQLLLRASVHMGYCLQKFHTFGYDTSNKVTYLAHKIIYVDLFVHCTT